MEDKQKLAVEIGKIKKLEAPKVDQVTLLSALKWFNKDFSEKGITSEALQGYLLEDLALDKEKGEQSPQKLKSVEELLSLSYLSYL